MWLWTLGQEGGGAWKKQLIEFCSKWNLAPGYSPWTSRANVLCAKLLPRREQSIVDMAWADRLRRNNLSEAPLPENQLVKGYFVDVSESLPRTPWGSIRALRQKTLIYSFEADGLLKPRHSMSLHGFPKNLRLDALTDASVRSLAGESFAMPCIASVIWALFLVDATFWVATGATV